MATFEGIGNTVDATLGALEVGTMISIGLYGLITLQVYVYAQGKYDDHVTFRILVSIMWLVDTLQTIFLCHLLYHLTITTYGRPESILVIHWGYPSTLILNGIMGVVFQSFTAYRIKVLSKRLHISLFSWFICVVRMGMYLVVAILASETNDWLTYIGRYKWTVPTLASVTAFGDILNTMAICFWLSMRKTGYGRTNYFINKLITWAIETGLITSICALTTVILYATIPHTFAWVAVFLCFPKFYSISMLVSLNNRENMRRVVPEVPRDETSGSTGQLSFGRVQDGTTVEMVSMRPGDEWGGQKRAPLDY